MFSLNAIKIEFISSYKWYVKTIKELLILSEELSHLRDNNILTLAGLYIFVIIPLVLGLIMFSPMLITYATYKNISTRANRLMNMLKTGKDYDYRR